MEELYVNLEEFEDEDKNIKNYVFFQGCICKKSPNKYQHFHSMLYIRSRSRSLKHSPLISASREEKRETLARDLGELGDSYLSSLFSNNFWLFSLILLKKRLFLAIESSKNAV